jgi:adenylyl-sulfate kinase
MTGNPFTVWLTGLSGAGKSTLARALSGYLNQLGRKCEVLDGDELRRTINRDLGFSKQDRDENVRRIADLARALNERGVVAFVAAISPYREGRDKARQQCHHFVEVFVDCPVEILIRRDPKGLYRRALAGEIQNLSGVTDPYEAPESPDIYINSGNQTWQESVDHIICCLASLGYLLRAINDPN